jgi:hypothetical protein
VVTGEIAEFTREPLRRKPGGSASESGDRYRLPLEQKSEMRHRMFVNVTIEDRRKNVTYFEGKRITRRVEFRLNSGETARMARDELVRELARRVVSLAFERWPTRTPEAVARGG